MMKLNKNEIKVIKAFLIETNITRQEFAKDAEIGVRTLYNALQGLKIKETTYDKIINTMLSETMQRKIINPAVQTGLSETQVRKVIKIVGYGLYAFSFAVVFIILLGLILK